MSFVDYTGQTLDGRYCVERLLGKGGMGAVYLGRHLVIGREVAIKFLHAELAADEDVVKRFYREAQAAAAIRHKNIIDVLDVGVAPEGEPYLVMEYLEGEDLASMIKRVGSFDLATACGILEPVLLALAAAHEKGIIHRDLKPENIFLAQFDNEPTTIKLIDFGISKFVQAGDKSRLTQTGMLLGTPAYMSPEQAKGGGAAVDTRTDIYAMGVILYEMLTGALPFKGEHYNELLINVLTEPPISPRDANPMFPVEAEDLVMKTLSKVPDERPRGATDMLDRLRRLKAFEKRSEGLTLLTSGIKKRNFAGGNLGKSISTKQDRDIAANLLAQIKEGRTPSEWAGTKVRARKRTQRVNFLLAGLGVAVLGLAGFLIVGAFSKENPDPKEMPVAVPRETSNNEIGVQITLQDVPEGARIYVNDSLVDSNPVWLKKSHIIIPFRVEMDAFEPYRVSVIPSKDRSVWIKMKKIKTKTEDSPDKAEPVEPQAHTKTVKTAATKKKGSSSSEKKKSKKKEPAGKKLIKNKRGLEIAEDFE